MTSIFIVPGLGGSGEDHWQSHWERSLSDTCRIQQHDWNNPNLTTWSQRLIEAIACCPGAVVVGHSLGCALIAHVAQSWAGRTIGGALLVAPADVDLPHRIPRITRQFAPLPRNRLPFPATVVGSTNDPYMSIERARDLARLWGAHFVNLGAAGHINVQSGFGPWPDGERILGDLLRDERVARSRPARHQIVH